MRVIRELRADYVYDLEESGVDQGSVLIIHKDTLDTTAITMTQEELKQYIEDLQGYVK